MPPGFDLGPRESLKGLAMEGSLITTKKRKKKKEKKAEEREKEKKRKERTMVMIIICFHIYQAFQKPDMLLYLLLEANS